MLYTEHPVVSDYALQLGRGFLLPSVAEIKNCPEKGRQSQSQKQSETICLCVSWAGWGPWYLLSVSPLWPLTDRLTGKTGRRLSDSHWHPLQCLGSNSRQLAWLLWWRFVCFGCVEMCWQNPQNTISHNINSTDRWKSHCCNSVRHTLSLL